LRELARKRQPICSFAPGGHPVEAAFFRQAWSALKAEEAAIGRTATLPVDEDTARRVDGLEGMRVVRSVTTTLRDFIRMVESVLGSIAIDTDSLTQTFPVPGSRPAPAEPEPEPPRHSEEEEAAPPESEPALPAPRPEPKPKPVRKRRPKMKRRQIQLAVAVPIGFASLKPAHCPHIDVRNWKGRDAKRLHGATEVRVANLGNIAVGGPTLFVVRRDFKDLIAQAEKQEAN
jgi:hypothetical protein